MCTFIVRKTTSTQGEYFVSIGDDSARISDNQPLLFIDVGILTAMEDILSPEVGEAFQRTRTGDSFRVTHVDESDDSVKVEYVRGADYPRNTGSLTAFREAVRNQKIERSPSLDST